MPPSRHPVVVVCPPGLESLVVAELAVIGVRGRTGAPGVVRAQVSTRELYLANATLAVASRVLVDGGSWPARTFEALIDGARSRPWDRWWDGDRPVRFRITAHRSRLHHTGAVEERLRTAIGAVAPARPEDPDALLVVVRLERDRLSLRIDSSGAALHRRGWRGPAAKAPLRETLAAACLVGAGWVPGSPLLDPFCGSGTIAIEAARRVAGKPPGSDRTFGFQAWPSFAPGTWASVRAEIDARPALGGSARSGSGLILASDRDAGAVAAARANAERAGVADLVEIRQGAVSTVVDPPAGTGWLVSNPPWGGRVKGGDPRNLYARLGQVARERLPGWQVGLLVADPVLAGHTGLALAEVWRATSGGTPVRLVAGPVT